MISFRLKKLTPFIKVIKILLAMNLGDIFHNQDIWEIFHFTK